MATARTRLAVDDVELAEAIFAAPASRQQRLAQTVGESALARVPLDEGQRKHLVECLRGAKTVDDLSLRRIKALSQQADAKYWQIASAAPEDETHYPPEALAFYRVARAFDAIHFVLGISLQNAARNTSDALYELLGAIEDKSERDDLLRIARESLRAP